jgi:sulfite reductase (NADPH) flavoprotein alpha-component
MPGKRVISLTVSSDPARAVRVTATEDRTAQAEQEAKPAKSQTPPKRERRYADPFTGTLLNAKTGGAEAFFGVAEQLHRNLSAGQVGRALVGISTIVLVFMAASGLYLRWPRRVFDWRVWLKMSMQLRGSAFWLRLHSVLGTWVLLSYLLLALTGLYFAYPWYRTTLIAAVGAQPPVRGPVALNGEHFGPIDVERVWRMFETQHVAFTSAEINIPERPSQAAEIRYLPADAMHERAFDRMIVRPDNGELIRHERYRDKALADRFIASMFPLHAGSYFGVVGLSFTMLASLAMPIFAVSGLILYLARRRLHARSYSQAASSVVIESK